MVNFLNAVRRDLRQRAGYQVPEIRVNLNQLPNQELINTVRN
jgi:hypothetical protein